MSCAGQKFYSKAHRDSHPEQFFQHRGKGRYYPVSAEGATVPPPQLLQKFKAEKKQTKASLKTEKEATKPSLETEGGEEDAPLEAKVPRKRRAGVDPNDQPVILKETRTRKGSAPNAAIDVDEQQQQPASNDAEDASTTTGEKRKRSLGDDDISDEIPVAAAATVKLPNKITPKIKAKASPPTKKKKTARAAPKPRMKPVLEGIDGMTYKYQGPKSFREERGMGKTQIDADFVAMGIMEPGPAAARVAAAARRPEPVVDSTTQRTTGTLKRLQEELEEARKAIFEKKQDKLATAARSGASKKHSKQIDVDEPDIDFPSNWVLFDPRHDFPPVHSPPPEIFQRLQHFKPANSKIVAYNVESYACALRQTPAAFEGCEVQYGRSGMKLVKLKEKKTEARIDSPIEIADSEEE
ncbi:uncharacterized protein RCC_06968 [Ramularia collo-cygni]|uniref:Uncharacterized protein n=1 Tax=Ramularia collo-cygni TaxID=112498 RepID=A0A2D3V8K7_9PEZI|nr:uncharacterized protein RCC_06968 [Ramularia collo-cygni]CZT21107.1 uncharacterized protein RCC_06968 [Ramularia collo-cygni]